MQTFDQSLFDLYSKQLITLDEALARASNADEFKLRIQGIRSAADSAREEMASQMADFERFVPQVAAFARRAMHCNAVPPATNRMDASPTARKFCDTPRASIACGSGFA